MEVEVDILLATYNGEKHIKEQIDSILQQNYPHFRLIIRDDGSTDGTLSILRGYAEQYPQKILLERIGERLGIIGNFSKLMAKAQNPYAFLCDQDDIWFPDKVRNTLSQMISLESRFGNNAPLLVHTDLKVVDESKKVVDSSFWRYSNLKPHHSHSLNKLLVQNVVTGCTTLLNRALIDLALPIPPEVIMHDWWIALVAAAFGSIEALDKPTMLYRQHHHNNVGAKNFRHLGNILEGLRKLRLGNPQRYLQAKCFQESYQHLLTDQHHKLISAFLLQPERHWLSKRYMMIRHRLFKNGLLRNMAELILG